MHNDDDDDDGHDDGHGYDVKSHDFKRFLPPSDFPLEDDPSTPGVSRGSCPRFSAYQRIIFEYLSQLISIYNLFS